jgi:hypothetical protein
MSYTTSRIASIALLLGFATASTLAAGLKDKPPEGLKLAGTEWQLDPYNSDDPNEAIDRAARKAQQASVEPRGSTGGVFGGDDPLGRHGSRDPMGGHYPGDPIGGSRGFPSDSGSHWPSGDGRNSADIDPTGAGGTVTMQMGGRVGGSIFLESLRRNPEKLTFSEGNQSVTVTEDSLVTECEAGSKEPFSDSFSDGVRSCGWGGRAWVVETKRGKQFSRTDRYELSKDGRTLRYTTTASDEGIGRVTIERRYQLPIHK